MKKSLCLIGMLGALNCAPVIAGENMIKVYCGEKSLDIELADNTSARAFAEKLASGDITVKMSDYGDFEKTGDLGFSLPQTDEHITTTAGDITMYLGHTIGIYYDDNAWVLTRIGKIPNMTRETMLEFLGGYGDKVVTFSAN